MATIRQTLVLLLGLALLLLSLFPPWSGRLYHPNQFNAPSDWTLSGSFGLDNGPNDYILAPIWAPPKPFSPLIQPKLRWPGQPAFHPAHIEIAMARLVARWSCAYLALSIPYLFIAWLWPSTRKDYLLPFAWTTTPLLILAWISIGILTILSMGYAATDDVLLGFLIGGWILGLAWGLGLRLYRRTHQHPITKRQP